MSWARGKPQSQEHVEKRKAKLKEFWSNPDNKARLVGKNLSKRLLSSLEEKVSYLETKYNLPIVRNNGQMMIAGFFPDFVHESKPLVIEVYSPYVHPGNYEQTRTETYNKAGYKVLFLHDGDLKKENWVEWCLKKILDFINN